MHANAHARTLFSCHMADTVAQLEARVAALERVLALLDDAAPIAQQLAEIAKAVREHRRKAAAELAAEPAAETAAEPAAETAADDQAAPPADAQIATQLELGASSYMETLEWWDGLAAAVAAVPLDLPSPELLRHHETLVRLAPRAAALRRDVAVLTAQTVAVCENHVQLHLAQGGTT